MRSGIVLVSVLAFAPPVMAQGAEFCQGEVSELSEAFSLAGADDGRRATIAGAPGTRVGAELDQPQRARLHRLTEQATLAAKRGDAAQSQSKLNEARAILRQSGVGLPAQTGVDPSGTVTDPWTDRSPNLQGSQPAPNVRDALRDGSITSPAERVPGPGISGDQSLPRPMEDRTR
jgi:hypothetical protein